MEELKVDVWDWVILKDGRTIQITHDDMLDVSYEQIKRLASKNEILMAGGTPKDLQYRMYFFVPYNLSPIQQAIQAGHAALEYAYNFNNDSKFISFIENDKTWIILNGGTTNKKTTSIDNQYSTGARYIPGGTLDQILRDLMINKIKCSCFHEPDLNDALTAICFLADERVWDFENYPDFDNDEYSESKHIDEYKPWIQFMGGENNLFLRELIRNKKLA
jgi:hypothetical protein